MTIKMMRAKEENKEEPKPAEEKRKAQCRMEEESDDFKDKDLLLGCLFDPLAIVATLSQKTLEDNICSPGA